MQQNLTLALFLSALILLSCNRKTDLNKEEKAIRDLLQQERKAHFDRNTDLFVAGFADSMTAVNKGKVTTLSREQNKKRVEPYFNSVEFIKWDDVTPPVIRFADDGSLAYAIVQKLVILTYPDSTGKAFYDTAHYAWASVYRKQEGEWKVECNISTNK
jgi:hypothetical protein